MSKYKYRVITEEGKSIQGIYEAKSKEDVLQMLRQNKFYPLEIKELVKGQEIDFKRLFNKVSIKDIAVFCRQFQTMLDAGVSLISCLDILRQQTENNTLRVNIGKVYDKVQQGLTLSEAMRKHSDIFPELLINMVVAGEASGNLDTILERMANHYEKETRILSKVKNAMVYPMVVGVIAVFVVIFLLVFVLPSFIGIFESSNVPLPLPTRLLISASDFLTNYWYIVVGIVILFIVALIKLLKLPKIRYGFDRMKLKLPVLKGINQKVITSRFARTLATLLSSGMPLLQSLDIVSKIVNNKLVEQGINKAKEDVKRGIPLSVPIKNMNLFPPMLISMLAIGEETGEIDDILNKTANYYDDQAEAALEAMTKLVEPLMLVVMALVVGSIVSAIILPMFDMMTNITM